MKVNEFPDRKITVDGVEYLYFGGTNYLGISTNANFQDILFKSIKKWGTGYGSSRNANVKLSIYEIAEKLLAKNFDTQASVTVSSGMLAGKLVVDYFLNANYTLFHFPDTHPALLHSSSLPILENGKLNPKILETNSENVVFADAVPSLSVVFIDLSILKQIPKANKITLVLDESHSIGILENVKIENKISIASLGKGYGLSGGVIAGNNNFITKLKKQDAFVGASGMNPALLETFVNAQDLYKKQRQKLQQNIDYVNEHFVDKSGFAFDSKYPVIYFDDNLLFEFLLENKIIITSFDYPTSSGKLNRIVITANHNQGDLEKLIFVLNFYQKKK